jgi:glycerol uptake facilitator-like aquaporin
MATSQTETPLGRPIHLDADAAPPAVPHITVRALAEFIGTALLLIVVVGSGIQAQRLSSDVGLELLENSIATGVGLVAIILALGPISGAHLNPVVTLSDVLLGRTTWRDVPAYFVAQFAGGVVGVILANLMFKLPAVTISAKSRHSPALWLAEVIATFGLVLVIYGVVRSGRPAAAPFAVGAYIAGAYWFTASTSFANPAVTVAREFSNTFAGIQPGSVVPFIVAQIIGGALAVGAARLFYPRTDTQP